VGTLSSFVTIGGGFVLVTTSSFFITGGSVERFEFVESLGEESSVLVFGTREPLNDFPTFTGVHPPPTFLFNQSLPLLTALSAICLVTLFTLFANVSNIFEQGAFDLLIGNGALLILLVFGFKDPLFLFLRSFVLEAFDFKESLVLRSFVLEAFDFKESLVLLRRGFDLTTAVFFEPVFLVIFFVLFPKLTFAFFLTADLNTSFAFFLPLQKLLSPFFRHCNPFLMAICFNFSAAAVLRAATPPVLTMVATVNPVLTIFPIFFSFFLKSTRLDGSDETI